MTGQRLGDWLLGEELGRGPLATVYRARAAGDPARLAAVKVFTHPETLRPEFLARFPAGMLALHRLDHPNIVRTYEAGVQAGRGWFAMELVEGRDAATVLRTRAKRPGEPGLSWADEVLGVVAQVARALKHGHHRSVLHRDLKPSNVMLTPGGLVKLADFGLAKLLPVAPTNLPVEPMGTLGYLPPEFFTGKPLTRKSDLYALGCLAYTLVGGRPPFVAGSPAEYTHKHCYTLPDRPAMVVPDLPPELDEWICELLAKDPNRRPATAAAVLDELGQIRAKLERKGRKIPWPPEPPRTASDFHLDEPDAAPDGGERDPRPRRPLMARPAVVLALLLLVVGAALALAFWPSPSAEELLARGEPLMQSADPADWEAAWDNYYGPLGEKYPGEYREEVAAAKRKVTTYRELRQAVWAGRRVNYTSEAERAYERGVKLAAAGDFAAANRAWGHVVLVYGPVESEAHWAGAARAAIAQTAAVNPAPNSPGAGLDAALGQLTARRAAGDAAGAKAILDALEDLHRDDPEALERLRRLK